MNTITSDNSLIYFEQNSNKSNIGANGETSITLVLKPYYYKVFNTIANEFKSTDKRYASFVKVWQNTCKDVCKEAKKALENYVKVCKKIDADTKDSINLVLSRFRKNLGMILTEALITKNILRINAEQFTVNHDCYEQIDATMEINGMPASIQVKNHNSVAKYTNNCEKRDDDYISHALAQNGKWFSDKTKISDEMLVKYRATPRQFVISFTQTNPLVVKKHYKSVAYFGPSDIDRLHLQGTSRFPGNWKFFEDIANEIEAVA